jgi:hypothetical protein
MLVGSAESLQGEFGFMTYAIFDKPYIKTTFVGAFRCDFVRDAEDIYCDEVQYLGAINPGAIAAMMV